MRAPSDPKYRPCLANGKRIPHTNELGMKSVRFDHPMLKESIQWDWVTNQERNLEKTRKVFQEFVDGEEWAEALGLLKTKARFPYLMSIRSEMSEGAFYRLLRGVLVTNETLRSFRNPLGRLLRRVDLDRVRPLMMARSELKFLQEQPERFLVWRGTGDCNLGWAWSCYEHVAHWYASRYASANTSQQGFVMQGVVNLSDVIAAFVADPKGHGTMIIDPDTVHIMKVNVVGSLCPFDSPEERWAEAERRGAAKRAEAKTQMEAARKTTIQVAETTTTTTKTCTTVTKQTAKMAVVESATVGAPGMTTEATTLTKTPSKTTRMAVAQQNAGTATVEVVKETRTLASAKNSESSGFCASLVGDGIPWYTPSLNSWGSRKPTESPNPSA